MGCKLQVVSENYPYECHTKKLSLQVLFNNSGIEEVI
jgi:hypothetical protein